MVGWGQRGSVLPGKHRGVSVEGGKYVGGFKVVDCGHLGSDEPG